MPQADTSERQPLLSGGEDDERPKQSWQRWAVHNKFAIAASTLAAVFLIAFVTTLATHVSKEARKSSKAELCNSPECVIAASTLLQSVSPRYKDIDPCEDFRAYACEGFDNIHEMREDQTIIGSLSVMDEEGQLILKRILESDEPPQSESLFWTASSADQEIFTKLRNGYKACMDESHLKSLGSKPLVDMLVDLHEHLKKGGLSSAISFLMDIGAQTPIDLRVGPDDKDPDTNVLVYSPPYSFGLPSKQYYNNTELVEAYKNTIGQVLEALNKDWKDLYGGPSSAMSDALTVDAEHVRKVVEFERAMALAGPDPEYLEDITKTYNPRTLDEAESYNPSISLKSIIGSFSEEHPKKVIVASPDFLKSLNKIVKAQSERTILAYVVWKGVVAYEAVTESESLVPLRRFNNKLRGKAPDAKQERWRKCASSVDNDLPWILSRFFIEKAFSQGAKDLGDSIIRAIKDEFISKLKNSEWMTPSVRKLAISKVDQIRQKIGYPTSSPDVTSAEAIAKYYHDLHVNSSTYFENHLSATRDEVARGWAELGKPVDRETWLMSASTVNAYYNPPGNEIVFPAGIMQSPVFYGPEVPSYLSFGAFGAVAGHELSHAFDSSGSNYDQNGNYSEWWDQDTLKAFRKRTSCFAEQYSNYSIPTADGPVYVNGKLTLGENIADAGGLSAAFQSWRTHEAKNGEDKVLPGMGDFSKEQAFFLAYGLTWCGKAREAEAVRRVYTDPHSPPEWRVMGTTANSREFREAFNCPVKKPTCELW